MRFGIGLVAALGFLLSAPLAHAVTVTFDARPTTTTGLFSLPSTVVEAGVKISEFGSSIGLGVSPGFASPIGANGDRFSSNGTPSIAFNGFGGTGSGLRFEMDDGSAFNLISLDAAEMLAAGDFAASANATFLRFDGFRSDGTSVALFQTFDGQTDGAAPLSDFQTFTFSGFENLQSFIVRSNNRIFNGRISSGYFMLDNVALSAFEPPKVIPGPAPGLLILSAFAASLGLRRYARR